LLAGSNGKHYGDVVIDYLENEIFRTLLAPDDVAGVLLEPIQGEGGYVIPPSGFIARLREVCDRHGILLIADEIQSGVARTGKWWAIEHEEVAPDIVCFAKGVGSGMPIGGIIATKEAMVWGPGAQGSTYGGNPVAAAAALATLNVIEEEGLAMRAAEKGEMILDALVEMQGRHASMGDVRGRGLMIGIEFVKDRQTKERAVDLRNAVIEEAFSRGLLLIPCGANSIRMTPALNVPDTLIEEGLQIFAHSLAEMEPQYL
jgi:4-aminobutyrate aminotransferase